MEEEQITQIKSIDLINGKETTIAIKEKQKDDVFSLVSENNLKQLSLINKFSNLSLPTIYYFEENGEKHYIDNPQINTIFENEYKKIIEQNTESQGLVTLKNQGDIEELWEIVQDEQSLSQKLATHNNLKHLEQRIMLENKQDNTQSQSELEPTFTNPKKQATKNEVEHNTEEKIFSNKSDVFDIPVIQKANKRKTQLQSNEESTKNPLEKMVNHITALSMVLFGKTVKTTHNIVDTIIGVGVKIPVFATGAITVLDGAIGTIVGLKNGIVDTHYDSKLNPDKYNNFLDTIRNSSEFIIRDISSKIDTGLNNFTIEKIQQAGMNTINLFTEAGASEAGKILGDMLWNNPEPYLISSIIGAGIVLGAKSIIGKPISFTANHSIAIGKHMEKTGEFNLLETGKNTLNQEFKPLIKKINNGVAALSHFRTDEQPQRIKKMDV